jgi:oligopeptide/dipeptide ABC transporter ATP-binding protein
MTASEPQLGDQNVSDTDTIFEVEDVSVTFDMERGVSKVLDGISMEINRGEIVGVVGESGSGKSMFASSLLDAVVDPGVLSGDITYFPKSGGEVDVLDINTEQLRLFRWEEVSMVFQGAMSSFNPTKKILDHFLETIKAHGEDKEECMSRARQLFDDLYLDSERVLDSYPHELSGGMKQRTLIALSLVLEPDVLVLDEPTAALDLLMQRSIIQLLRDIKQKYDLTIVFITHDLPLVAELADRLAIMYAFEFVEIGSTGTIMEEAAHPYTRSLLNVTPDIDAPVDEMETIDGSSPDPVDIPDGCSYHPRCSLADEMCVQTDPGYYDVSETHHAKCHHWEDAAEAVPFPHEKEGTNSEDRR